MVDKTPQPTDNKAQDQGGEQPQSTRDTIRAAFAEQREKEQKAQESTEVKKPEVKEPEAKKVETKEVEVKTVEPKETETKVTEVKETEAKVEDKEVKEVEAKPKPRAPFGLPKAIRDKFESIDPEVQEFLSKTLKENLDQKANEGRRGPMKEVEQALSPLMGELQNAGVTPAQYVKRMVEYTYALGHPQAKYNAIAQLARDYQIDLSLFANAKTDDKTENKEQVHDAIPPELNAKLDNIINEFTQLKTTQKSGNEKAALDTINSWAGFDPMTNEFKAKPFFPHVRQTMHSLISSGAVPLKDGKIDLDGAYDAACYAHPEIREYLTEESTKSAQAEILRQQKQQQQQVVRAKNAGSSLKPGAPAPRSLNPSNPKLNAKGQPLTVRDSLRQALSQLRDSQ